MYGQILYIIIYVIHVIHIYIYILTQKIFYRDVCIFKYITLFIILYRRIFFHFYDVNVNKKTMHILNVNKKNHAYTIHFAYKRSTYITYKNYK